MPQSFKNASIQSVGVTNTTLLTAGNPTIVHALRIANIDGTNQGKVTITLYDDSAALDIVIAESVPVPAGSVFKYDGQITLEANDLIRVKADVAGRLSANSSHVEIS